MHHIRLFAAIPVRSGTVGGRHDRTFPGEARRAIFARTILRQVSVESRRGAMALGRCCVRFPCVRAAATTPVQRLGVVLAHLPQP
jgi:hypothetical protein